MKSFRSLLASAAFLSLLCPALAEVGARVTFPSFADGHVYGERISKNDLRGKVVFFEYWGIHCPPCRAAMPHLIEMQKKYASKGLLVIGSHVQGMSPEVKTYLEENKVNFPVYSFKFLPEAPCPGGIPYSVLIGANGRVIAEGFPSTLYGKVEAALAQASKGYPILEDVELRKYKSLERVFVAGANNLEGRMPTLRAAAAEGDAEAQAVCEAYDSWLESEKERIAQLCETNPPRALSSIAALEKSVPSVTDFDEQAKAFREMPVYGRIDAVQKTLQGTKKLQSEGKRVSASRLNSLRNAVEEIRGMGGMGVESMCDSFEADIAALSEAAEASAREKKNKRQKRRGGGN